MPCGCVHARNLIAKREGPSVKHTSGRRRARTSSNLEFELEQAKRRHKSARERSKRMSNAEQQRYQPVAQFDATTLAVVEADKLGSASSPLNLPKTLAVVGACASPRAGDVVVVRALTDSATYNQLELTTGRLAKINPGDVLVGVLGSRRALKGFVGDVPAAVKAGDELHLLNMGGVIGCCTGHHSSLSDAIRVEVLGLVADEAGRVRNIADAALALREHLDATAPLVLVGGACMNSGKTYAATELIKQATRAGLRVAAGKLSGVACLRDTLNM